MRRQYPEVGAITISSERKVCGNRKSRIETSARYSMLKSLIRSAPKLISAKHMEEILLYVASNHG